VKESLGNIVRVFLVIDVLMMSAVLTRPEKGGVLKGPGTKNQREKANNRVPGKRDAKRDGGNQA